MEEKLKISRLIRDKSVHPWFKECRIRSKGCIVKRLTGDRGRRYYHNLG